MRRDGSRVCRSYLRISMGVMRRAGPRAGIERLPIVCLGLSLKGIVGKLPQLGLHRLADWRPRLWRHRCRRRGGMRQRGGPVLWPRGRPSAVEALVQRLRGCHRGFRISWILPSMPVGFSAHWDFWCSRSSGSVLTSASLRYSSPRVWLETSAVMPLSLRLPVAGPPPGSWHGGKPEVFGWQ